MSVSHEEYNRFVQDAQAFAITANLKHRIDRGYSKQGELYASFEIYWDGWKVLGEEWRAMKPDCTRLIYPEEFARIQYEVAGELSK
jgi:hypothetical protein